MYLDKTPVALE